MPQRLKPLSFLLSIFLLTACGKSEVELAAIKWCECNAQKAAFYQELDKSPERIATLAHNILIEENNVLACLGGEQQQKAFLDKLHQAGNEKMKATYERTRQDLCSEYVELLKKRALPKIDVPNPKVTEPKIDSTQVDSTDLDSKQINN